jgi:hypothetical protein
MHNFHLHNDGFAIDDVGEQPQRLLAQVNVVGGEQSHQNSTLKNIEKKFISFSDCLDS